MSASIGRKPILTRLALKILGLAILFGFLPLLLIVGGVARDNEILMEQLAQRSLAPLAATRASELAAWIDARRHEVAGWAADRRLVELVAASEVPSEIPGTVRDRLERDLGHHQAFESLFVVDANGNVLAATRREKLEAWARRTLDARSGRDGLAGRIGFSAELGRPTLLIIEPVHVESRRPSAFLVGRLDLREIEHFLKPMDGDSPVHFLWIGHPGGELLASEGTVEQVPGERRIPGFDHQARYGSARVALPGIGDALYGIAAPTALDGTALVAATPRAAALRDVHARRREVVQTSLALVVFALLALGWAARGVLRPILMLSEGARRLSAGDLQVYLPVRGRDEISALTSTFNEMTRRLREGREDLEEARDGLARANQELRTVNQTLETLAITDGLTGLYNHRHFQDTLDKEIRRADREQRPLSLVMLDLDHFKQFNDRWGHTEGDAALRRVATQIMRTVRSTDMAFRYGGEELAVLLPSCSKEQAAEVAEKIRVAVAAGTRRRGPGSGLTVSGGVATAPEDGQMGRGLIDAADVALYAAKARGRNCIVVAGAFSEHSAS